MPSPAAPLAPWDMQPSETAKAYQAFQTYRDMGAGRSLEKLGQFFGKTKAAMEQWSVKHGWAERVRAFDAEAARRASEKSLNEHAEVRTRQAGLGRMMQARGAQRIGQLDPSTLEAKEARMLAVEGARMEREALGMGGATVAIDAAIEQVVTIVYRDETDTIAGRPSSDHARAASGNPGQSNPIQRPGLWAAVREKHGKRAASG